MCGYVARYAFRVGQDVVVPEAEYAIAVIFDGRRPMRIDFFVMLPAISFDHQLGAVAGEIDGILPDRYLAPETCVRESLA